MKFFASLFKRDELQRRGITIDEEVGHGTYSKVYKGRLRRSEEVITCKNTLDGIVRVRGIQGVRYKDDRNAVMRTWTD